MSYIRGGQSPEGLWIIDFKGNRVQITISGHLRTNNYASPGFPGGDGLVVPMRSWQSFLCKSYDNHFDAKYRGFEIQEFAPAFTGPTMRLSYGKHWLRLWEATWSHIVMNFATTCGHAYLALAADRTKFLKRARAKAK